MVAAIIPYFLERDSFWYEQNHEKIKKSVQNQIWWRENVLFLEKDLEMNLYHLLRKLVEMGYDKTQTVGAPGEFSQRGGVVDIFPINWQNAWRLEFLGNKIQSIEALEIKILRSQKEIQKELTKRQSQSLIQNLKPGDYLVHLDHGIGVFLGYAESAGGAISVEPASEESPAGYFVLEYAKNDKLYVPLALENKLSRYIGFERPIVHRLGGTLWFKTKRKAKENAIKLAQELLQLYAKHSLARGFRYQQDNELQRELEADFPFVETDDQAKAVAEVKADMESGRPMDRLICGDVGFGKTEVALRAALKAALSGKQVALIAPTTILAWQHYRTFEKRLKKFPVNLALLTRLSPVVLEQKENSISHRENVKHIIEQLKTGKIDIIIGTHRLLSRDIEFKNLGLVIIDEEQRFGVKQKEHFRKMRLGIEETVSPETDRSPLAQTPGTNDAVDFLSLTATPIPRTMHLTLAGLRDISVINTPPPGRLAVKTEVLPFDKNTVKSAIEKELARHGQVYYLYNRVETIGLAAEQLKKLVPPAKIAIIHGRLDEDHLLKIINDFDRQKINVLVATTIIENGLDFPNVNTLIVANAAKLGLAQAYQIRGRIGRSHVQAFAYFLYNSKRLTNEGRLRLEALEETQELGSGYQIALRDLEIRGAGNILGKEQSGPINSIGLNLYMQMLNETVEELKEVMK